jgi:hypothetical protein
MRAMTDSDVQALTGLIAAFGALVVAITGLVAAIRAHGKANSNQQAISDLKDEVDGKHTEPPSG